jgi:RNA polymerase sigma-70 factor, ECF subfamily
LEKAQRIPSSQSQRRIQFETLAMPLFDRLYATALHMMRDPARAEDMVQETYLRAWQNFDRFTPGTHFKAWIFKILTYLFLNDRRSAQHREHSVDFAESDPPDLRTVSAPSKTSETNWNDLYPDLVDDALKAALDRLPLDQRSVFLLVTLGEMSYQDCADELGIPIGTVMSRLFRARKQLQEDLVRLVQKRDQKKEVK